MTVLGETMIDTTVLRTRIFDPQFMHVSNRNSPVIDWNGPAIFLPFYTRLGFPCYTTSKGQTFAFSDRFVLEGLDKCRGRS